MRIPKWLHRNWIALAGLLLTVMSVVVAVTTPEIRIWLELQEDGPSPEPGSSPATAPDSSVDPAPGPGVKVATSPSVRIIPLHGYDTGLSVQVSGCEAVFSAVRCDLRLQNHLPFDQTIGLGTEGSFAVDARGFDYPAGWVTLGTAGNPSSAARLLRPGVSLTGSVSFNSMTAARGEVISRVRVGVEVDSVHHLDFPNVLISETGS